MLRAANGMATGGLVPDLTLLITLPVEDGLARAMDRGGHDRMERADLDFHERVAHAFTDFAAPPWQAAHPECGPIVPIDGAGRSAKCSRGCCPCSRRAGPRNSRRPADRPSRVRLLGLGLVDDLRRPPGS